MKKIYQLFIPVVIIAGLMNSCLKDLGNYEYLDKNKVVISYEIPYINGTVDEETVIIPNRQYAIPGMTSLDYDHEWYISDKLVSRDSNLYYVGEEPGAHTITYIMRDKRTGVGYFAPNNTLNLASPYASGYTILYEKNGESELAHFRYRASDTSYVDYVDIYKKKNNGESLGSLPVKLKNYPVSGTWSLVVAQHGGQGSIELVGNSMKKALVTSEAFSGGTPSNIKPINIGNYANAHLLVNTDGEVYPRLFSNQPIPFTMPWINIPLNIPKGMKITDLWDTHSFRNNMNCMYDKLNNRILYLNLNGPLTTGGYIQIDTLPKLNYPIGHVNLNNMGNWEYIWGGSFNDSPNTNGSGNQMDGVILMRQFGGQQIYLQSFNAKSLNRVYTFTPKLRMPFPGSQLVNSESVYLNIKMRNYIFFSGGVNNQDLYFFDIQSGGNPKLFAHMPSKITDMCESDNSLELVVGLEEGTAILYNISDSNLYSGQPKELHRLSGLGRIADITVRNGYMR